MTIHKLGFVSLAISTLVACSSDNGTTPTASGVFPADGFTGRVVRVEISGDATKWKDGATVSFGDGVTVNSVTVASPTDLFAEIKIDPTAMPGLRDVTVTSGKAYTLTQAFELKSAVELQFVGDVDQGAFPAYTIVNRDFDNPFDATQDQNLAYTNLTVTGPAGTNFILGNVTAYSISGFVSIDTDATPGAVTVTSGPASSMISSVSGSIDIKPRAATALTSGTATTAMLPSINDTVLFSLATTGSPSLVHMSLTSTDNNANPIPSLLPSSGHWSGQLGNFYGVAPTGGQVYVVVFDGGAEANYSFKITPVSELLTNTQEVNEPGNNSVATTQIAGTMIPYAVTGTLASAADRDFTKITVDAAHAGKRLHVATVGGSDPFTDTAVNVVASNGTTSFTGGRIDDDPFCSNPFAPCTGLGEDVVSDQLPANTYYVVVSAGGSFAPTDTAYTVMFWFE